MSELSDKIREEYNKGNIVFASIDGLMCVNLAEFLEQDTDGILYDLNRDELTVMTFIDDVKWINDFAVCKVIRALKDKINRLELQIERHE